MREQRIPCLLTEVTQGTQFPGLCNGRATCEKDPKQGNAIGSFPVCVEGWMVGCRKRQNERYDAGTRNAGCVKSEKVVVASGCDKPGKFSRTCLFLLLSACDDGVGSLTGACSPSRRIEVRKIYRDNETRMNPCPEIAKGWFRWSGTAMQDQMILFIRDLCYIVRLRPVIDRG